MSLTALALVLGLGAAAPAPPDPSAVLKATVATYQAARTFADTATEVQTADGPQPFSRTYTHRFYSEVPNRFLYDVREQGQLVALAVSDGKTLRIDNRMTGKKVEVPAPATFAAMHDTLVGAGMVTHGDPFAIIVLGAARGDDEVPAGTTLAEETLDGRPVYRLETPPSENEQTRLWIGRKDHLIYRFEQAERQNRGGVPVWVRAVETHGAVKIDVKLPADAFVAPQEP